MQAVNALPQSPSQKLATLLKSAGDPLRVEILRTLAHDSFGVLELSYIFDTRQNSMSHHLKVLATSGMVSTRREGNSIFYRRGRIHQFDEGEHDELDLARAMLFDNIDLIDLSASVSKRISDVYDQRAEASRRFFSEHGSSLKEKQDLIAAFEVYGEQVAQFLNANLSGLALEVGPGEGQFLQYLSEKFSTVIALDNSEIMLQSAREKCTKNNLKNIEFVLGDTQWCADQTQKFNSIIINMVLHHTPSPQQIFKDVSTSLTHDGQLLICELCQHNQDWTRQACGDLWLGFDTDELTRWASAANLHEGESTYLALRNGFQIQIREFTKHKHNPLLEK